MKKSVDRKKSQNYLIKAENLRKYTMAILLIVNFPYDKNNNFKCIVG
jgi:hypothetical protein